MTTSAAMLVLAVMKLLADVMDLPAGFVEQTLHAMRQLIEDAAIVMAIFFFLWLSFTRHVAHLNWLRLCRALFAG